MQNFLELFSEYYVLYRGDSDVPSITDPEFLIALSNANNAIRRWLNVDNVFWNELWTSLKLAGDGDKTISPTKTIYACPSDMRYPGGYVQLSDTNGNTIRVHVIEPNAVQLQAANSNYAYFTGDPNNGFTLTIQGPVLSGTATSMDYAYYKQPTWITGADSVPEMADPNYIIHFMLAQRFRSSRNYPSYQIAIADAEGALKNMQNANASGYWYNGWAQQDPLSAPFGS